MRFGGNFVWKTNLTLIFAQCSAKAVESKCGVNYEIPAFAGNALHSTKSMTLRVSQSMSIYALSSLTPFFKGVTVSKGASKNSICEICKICSLLKISVICVICGLKNPLRKSAQSAGEKNLTENLY